MNFIKTTLAAIALFLVAVIAIGLLALLLPAALFCLLFCGVVGCAVGLGIGVYDRYIEHRMIEWENEIPLD